MKEKVDKPKLYDSESIQRKVFRIRDNQVMLDSDLALFYGVETKALNQAVRRNSDRFPEEFMFQLTDSEWISLRPKVNTSNDEPLRSQNVTFKNGRGKHRKYLPYVFTEQGVAMLSAVLKSETAVKMSIQIISAFVAMRKFLAANAVVFQRLDNLEYKQIETDKKFEKVFDALQRKDLEPRQGVFFEGQIFDAHKFVSSLIRKAEKSILLLDNYIDESVLDLLTKKKPIVEVIILTKTISKTLKLDEKKFNEQYGSLTIKQFNKAHDRFIIIDDKDVYHFGASLKDLGKKWFAFSKMDKSAFVLLEYLEKLKIDEIA